MIVVFPLPVCQRSLPVSPGFILNERPEHKLIRVITKRNMNENYFALNFSRRITALGFNIVIVVQKP
jgi:hypothetical protein